MRATQIISGEKIQLTFLEDGRRERSMRLWYKNVLLHLHIKSILNWYPKKQLWSPRYFADISTKSALNVGNVDKHFEWIVDGVF